MANMEHIEQLLQGVKSWNSWRNESGGIRPDLSGANLSEADLVGANLSATKLIGTDLVGAG